MAEDTVNVNSKPDARDEASPFKPIEPGRKRRWRQTLLKGFVFLFAISYLVISYYRAPILTEVGRFLILEHPPQNSDLIVCLAGGNIERGLATADVYQRGLAPQIFIAREELPDSYALLKEKGIEYPRNVDLLAMVLTRLGVPKSAILMGDRPVKSTIEEASLIREVVKKRGYQSILIITSPTHTKRAWLTFRKVFEKMDVRILMLGSPYSEFRPENWWKKRKYIRTLIIEYQKLIFYVLRYGL